jgi:hypothetical protein
MNIKKIVTSLGMCSLFLSTYANAVTDSSTTYKNQRGSTLLLSWHKDFQNTGSLSGTFTTAVGNCKEDIGVPLPLVGYFNGNAISVTVNFPHCDQVVAVTGNVSNNLSTLHTTWLDANQVSDPREKNWNSNIIGSDSYYKISK